MLCMMFGQLSNRNRLRDLLVCISAHHPRQYHLGFGKTASRSNLAGANEERDYRIFELSAHRIVAQARKCCLPESDFNLSIQGNVFVFETTVIDLCLKLYWRASFRRAKAAVKGHTLPDVKTSIPVFLHVTSTDVHDVKGLDEPIYETGGYYIMNQQLADVIYLISSFST